MGKRVLGALVRSAVYKVRWMRWMRHVAGTAIYSVDEEIFERN